MHVSENKLIATEREPERERERQRERDRERETNSKSERAVERREGVKKRETERVTE